MSGWAFALLPAAYAVAWILSRGADGTARTATSTPHRAGRTVRDLAQTAGTVPFLIAWLAVNAVIGLWLQQAPYLFKLPERSTSQALVGGYSGREIGVIFSAWGLIFLVGIRP